MPDSRIDIAINLTVQDQAVQRLKDLNAELRRIPTEAQRVSASLESEIYRRGEYAGGRGVQNKLETLAERQAVLPSEIESAQRAVASAYIQPALRAPTTPIQELIERKTGVVREEDERDLIQPRNQKNMRSAFSPEAFVEARQTVPGYAAVDSSAREEAEARVAEANRHSADKQIEATEQAEQKKTAAAQREAAKRIREAEREAEQIARTKQQEQLQAERQAATQEKQRSQTLSSMSTWVDKQVSVQEKAAERGYQAADREVQRETATRKRQAEVDANAAIRAAAARDAAVQRSIQFDEQISHRGVSTATGEPRVLSYSELENAHYRLQRFGAEQQAQGAGGIFGRLNRQGALEGQAAIVNTIQALASGMNPLHVAMMESTQLAGAAVQGGLLSFKQILTFIGSTAGIAAVTLGTVATALGTIIYRGAEARSAMATTQGTLAARGFGGESIAGQPALIQERRQLGGQFRFLGSSSISEISSQFDRAAPEAQAFRGRLQTLSGSIGAQENIDATEAAKSLGKAAEQGADGIISFAHGLNIGDEIWREQLSRLASVDPKAAFEKALTAIEQRYAPGRAAAVSDPNAWFPGIPKLMESIKTDVNQGTIFNTARYIWSGIAPVNPTMASPRVDESTRIGVGLATRLTPEMKERNDLQDEYNKLLATQRELLQSINSLSAGGPEIDVQMERAARVNESIRNIEARDRPKGIEETRTDSAKMAQLQRNLTLAEQEAQHDISQAGKVQAARAAIYQETARQHAAAVELQANNSRRLSQAEIQAAQESETARRAMAQRTVDIMLQQSNLERARIGPANISAQREIVQRNVRTIETNRDIDQSVIIGQQTEELNILRQERLQVEDVNIAQLRQGELILQAKEDLAGIVVLRRQEAAIIERSADRTPADKVQARSNVIQSQIQAEAQARHLEIQNVDSLNQAEQRRLQTRTSLLNLQVETGAAASFQTIPVEQQLSSQTTNVQAGRIQALLATNNLERSERIRLNEQLAQLYEQDAQKQIDLQIRLTASIREENNRRVENFKNFFSSVESASSDLLVAGLLKSQTKQEALKSFATSVVTSFVRETESMASKFAGRGLANMLGVNIKEGEDTSVSNVLAKSLGSMLGITQPESKLDNAAVAQRMQQAGDAQKAAGDLMLQAAREMHSKAVEAPYRAGRGTEFSTDVVRETESRASTVGSPVKTYPGDSGDKVAATLRDRGWSDAAIQGALNNSMMESSLNPNAKGAAGERGLFQFHPGSHIKPFESAYGGSWTPEAQTNYMADVVERTMPGYKNISDSKEATRQFLTGFEKPKNQSESQVSARYTNNTASEAILTRVKSGEKVIPLDEPLPVSKSRMPDINTLGSPGGPKGMDYIFGKTIPRPEVDSSGNIIKYGVDPKQAEADRVTKRWEEEEKTKQNYQKDSTEIDRSGDSIAGSLKSFASRLNPISSAQANEFPTTTSIYNSKGLADQSVDMGAPVTKYFKDVAQGEYVKSGLERYLGNSTYDPARSLSENALDPQALNKATTIGLSFSRLGTEGWGKTPEEASRLARQSMEAETIQARPYKEPMKLDLQLPPMQLAPEVVSTATPVKVAEEATISATTKTSDSLLTGMQSIAQAQTQTLTQIPTEVATQVSSQVATQVAPDLVSGLKIATDPITIPHADLSSLSAPLEKITTSAPIERATTDTVPQSLTSTTPSEYIPSSLTELPPPPSYIPPQSPPPSSSPPPSPPSIFGYSSPGSQSVQTSSVGCCPCACNTLDKPQIQQSQILTSPYPDVYSAVANSQKQWNAELKSTQIKIDPTTVTQGVLNAQQQSVSEIKSSIQEGTIQGQQAAVQAATQDSQQTQRNSQASSENTSALREVTQVYRQANQPTGAGLSTASNGTESRSVTTAAAPAEAQGGLTVKGSLSTLSQGLGLASSAALLFGNHLSTSGRIILGSVSLLTNGLSFLSSATTLLQGANVLNTAATTTNTVATVANSAAQSSGSAAGVAGTAAKALPFALAALEQGGIVSAAEGATIPSAEGGAFVQPVISAAAGTIMPLSIDSAAGGMQVKEHALPASIRSGIRQMATSGRLAPFRSARMTGSGPPVADGKGGRLIVAHEGEMIVPAADTKVILASMNSAVPSAEGGMTIDRSVISASEGVVVLPSAESGLVVGGDSILAPAGVSARYQTPSAAKLPANLGVNIREAISNNFTAPSTNNSVNNAPVLNYSPNMTGYHPYRSRADMEGMLRQHGSAIMGFLERAVRNGNYPSRSF